MDEQNPAPPTDTSPETPTGETGKTFTQDELNQVIADRLKRERETIKKQLAQDLADEARKKELSQTTEAEKLQAEIARLNSELEASKSYQSAFEDTLQARINAIPEDMRSRIPEYDDPRKTMAWLDKNADLFAPSTPQKRPAQSLDGGAGTTQSNSGLTPEELEMAHKLGLSPERYLKEKRG